VRSAGIIAVVLVRLTIAAITLAAGLQLVTPSAWTQFRLHNDNNAVLPGRLSVSWHITTDGGFSSSPTVADGTLYIGNNAGQLFAVDPMSGKIKWTYKVSNPLMSAPIVYGPAVIVGEGDESSPNGSSPSHPIRVGDPPSALIALDRQSGALLWRTALQGSGMPTPAIIGGILLHHNGAGTLLALDPASGRTLYARKLRSIASMSAIVPIGGDAFITAGVDTNAVWAMHAKDGSLIWRSLFSPVASGMGDCPSATDSTRAYCTYVAPPTSATPVQTERSAQLRAYAVDLKSGKRVWDVPLERGQLPKRNEAAIPLLAQNAVFLGSSVSGIMHALDPSSGQMKWHVTTHGPVKGGIVDVGGILYFGDLGGYLWALNGSNGHAVGVKNVRTPFNVGSPTVVGNTLFIGSRGGTLMAVPLSVIRASHDK
jgi:outer membrane protein assembly factor BamB